MRFKRMIAVISAAAMLTSCLAVGTHAAAGRDYRINNTYAGVDWSTYGQYKADLHAHSTASDGNSAKYRTVEEHYRHGYDIMALTDHGTVDYGWDTDNVNTIVKIGATIRRGKLAVGAVSASGTAENGKRYTYDGTNYTQYNADGTAERSMLRVPFGNEQNPTSFNNAHVCTWFADYGDGSIGGTSDYETPIRNVDRLGGLSVINHPGEYSGARNERHFEDAYDQSNLKYRYIANKFADLLKKYDSCLGVDVNSKGDFRTRYDRKLWDILLEKVVPSGRNVFALATSDSHNDGIIHSGYTLMCMPEKTVDALKNCMKNGEFFAASRYIGSREEIKAWSDELKAAGVGSELAKELTDAYNAILAEEQTGIQNTIYEFDEEAAAPRVTGITVDEAGDRITVSAKDAYLVHWIADGRVIAVGNSIDLDEHSDEIGSYVRAEIIGRGGVIYTQAFTLEYEGAPQAEDAFFVDLGGATTLLADTIVKALAFVLNKSGVSKLIYNIIYR